MANLVSTIQGNVITGQLHITNHCKSCFHHFRQCDHRSTQHHKPLQILVNSTSQTIANLVSTILGNVITGQLHIINHCKSCFHHSRQCDNRSTPHHKPLQILFPPFKAMSSQVNSTSQTIANLVSTIQGNVTTGQLNITNHCKSCFHHFRQCDHMSTQHHKPLQILFPPFKAM